MIAIPPLGGGRGRRRVLLGSTETGAITPPTRKLNKTLGLPGEGLLYDALDVSNIFDLGETKFTAAAHKSFRIDVLSRLLDVDMPARLVLGGRLGTLWSDGPKYEPIGKASVSVRILDLGGSKQERGWLKWKGVAKTNGRMTHGFEIERCVTLGNLKGTNLYGNVSYVTSNRLSKGVWSSSSSFGIDQGFKLWGLHFNARVGLTPEGKPVYDLRL